MTTTITLLGKERAIRLPPQFAVKEELVVAYGESEGNTGRRMRVLGAIVGMCTDLGPELKADYVKARFDVLAYGGAVYGSLRERGVSAGDVAGAAYAILPLLSATVFPREQEVAERAGFTAPAAAE